MTVALANPKRRFGLIAMKIAILLAGAAAIFLLLVPVTASSARFVWNTSASAPAGIYWIDHVQWRVGDRVAVLPSADLVTDLESRGILPSGKLLIKRVVAGKGMTVCRHRTQVLVDKTLMAVARQTSSLGENLPSWQGCVQLYDDNVFLLGDTANSYDGRYFGVTDEADIVGVVRLVLPFPSSADAK